MSRMLRFDTSDFCGFRLTSGSSMRHTRDMGGPAAARLALPHCRNPVLVTAVFGVASAPGGGAGEERVAAMLARRQACFSLSNHRRLDRHQLKQSIDVDAEADGDTVNIESQSTD